MEVDELDEGGAGVRSGVWEDRLSRLGRSSQEGNGSGKGGEDADGEDDEKGGVRSGGGGIGDLDRRLAMLEDLIGPSDLVPDQVRLFTSLLLVEVPSPNFPTVSCHPSHDYHPAFILPNTDRSCYSLPRPSYPLCQS